MSTNRFAQIRLMLHAANELMDEGKISLTEYETLVKGIEKDYNRIVVEMETNEVEQLLLNYLNRTS